MTKETDCKTAQALIQPYTDRSITDPELRVLIRHVRSCRNCRNDLETAYLAENASRILDEDHDDVDPAKLLEEDLLRSEHGLNRRLILAIVLWAAIIFMAGLIFVIAIRLVSPETFKALGHAIIDFFDIEIDLEFWKGLAGI